MDKCCQARANFKGHYQPHIPRDLGFYDLRMPETFQAQIELAKKNSIFGFCFYYYWFSGRRILEKPIDIFFNEKIDFPFCFCWANENWTKRWDGGNNEILLANDHSIENDNRFIEDVFPYMKDNGILHITANQLFSSTDQIFLRTPKRRSNIGRSGPLRKGFRAFLSRPWHFMIFITLTIGELTHWSNSLHINIWAMRL
jgi:lipopolysaccharide biosynthesis protein